MKYTTDLSDVKRSKVQNFETVDIFKVIMLSSKTQQN
jgi:hypothetical protein